MFSADTLNAYVHAGLLTACPHPADPALVLYNYTRKCSFARSWDDVTTRARGLVIDWRDGGRVLANPIPKFWPLVDGLGEGEAPLITPKIDGWFGIIFHWRGTWQVTTRGKFLTSVTPWARRVLNEEVDQHTLDPAYTYLVELVHPLTRVVVDYDWSGFAFIAARHTATGRETPGDPPCPKGMRELPVVQRSLQAIVREDRPNEEGYVLHWPAKDRRAKVKFPWYEATLRRIATHDR